MGHMLLVLLLICCLSAHSFIHSLTKLRGRQFAIAATMKYNFFATTVSGLELVLVKELQTLPDVFSIEPASCGAHFSGSIRTGLMGMMNLRTSLKLMELIADDNRIRCKDDLFSFVDDVDWSLLLDSEQSLKVDTSIGLDLPPDLTHTHFTALSVKNAIVDQFRRNTGGVRPNVDIDDADLPLLLYLHQSSASLYRVWSGCQSMHKRGYRAENGAVHKAALRETTAAALLSLSGWTSASASSSSAGSQVTLCDPMCGSGTIPIEAALMACDTAPGLLRYSWEGPTIRGGGGSSSVVPCPLKWKDLRGEGVEEVWSSVVQEALQRDKRREQIPSARTSVLIRASDSHKGSLQLAQQAAVKAGVDHMIHFDHCTAEQADPPAPPLTAAATTLILTNPPWDRRLSEGAEEAWTHLGHFARKCGVDSSSSSSSSSSGGGGSALYVLTGNEDLPPLMGLSRRALRRKHAFNAAGVKMKLHEYR